MNFENKKIGIWGFGIVGKSAFNFFSDKTVNISVMDQRRLTAEEQECLTQHQVTFIEQNKKNAEQFLQDHDYVLISPGIDIRSYNFYQTNKFISELDLFQHYFTKPIVAITGTVGKTTVTHLLTKALTQAGKKIACGGNIGIGVLDLVNQQNDVDMAVIEVSSFQLERSSFFAPDLAVITNIYENHLDRHHDMKEYIMTKMSFIQRQNAHQRALITNTVVQMCNKYTIAHPKKCIIPDVDKFSNELLVRSIAQMLGIFIEDIHQLQPDSSIQEHRGELVTTDSGISFYNDSKSTISESTLLATTRILDKSIILLLGGINKTAAKREDRARLIQQLPKNVIYIAAFGAEAEIIKQVSTIHCESFDSLETAFAACIKQAKMGDCIVLSPGGSSYDLYSNYKERGGHFKQLIKSYNSNQN